MNKKMRLHLYIIFTPFVVGAAFEFLPLWVAWPIALLGAMTWFGSCALVAQEK
jgi:uncharacterized membrane protein (DUF4010 family)